MRRFPLVSLGVMGLFSVGRATEIRFFLGYGDQCLVDYARFSGADPSATIGSEIPENLPLRVPDSVTNGGRFKVQFYQEYVSGPDAHIVSHGLQTHIAYDQAFSSEGAENQAPDNFSFNKLTYGRTNRSECISNFQQFLGYWPDGTPVDHDGDGTQDYAIETAYGVFTRGSYGSGDSVRPVGLAASVGHWVPGLAGVNIRMYKNVAQHLFDVEMRSLMLVGEQYGNQGTETGLNLLTNPNLPTGGDTGNSTWISPHVGVTFTGAKYNLLAVPEPSSLLVVGLGLLALWRRR